MALFKKIFGRDTDKNSKYHIVYAKLLLDDIVDQQGNLVTHPYTKQPRMGSRLSPNFSIENPVSSCELRAGKYLASCFGTSSTGQPEIISDLELDSLLDLSFISLGGFSNYKSMDVMENASNRFIRLNDSLDNFVSVESGNVLIAREEGFDYGLILRIRPVHFKNRVWIACVGLGEWGTSGAAWYLAQRWKKILKEGRNWFNAHIFAKDNDFAALVKVREGQDQSTILVKQFRKSKEINDYAENVAETMFQEAEQISTLTPPPSGTLYRDESDDSIIADEESTPSRPSSSASRRTSSRSESSRSTTSPTTSTTQKVDPWHRDNCED